MASTTNEIEKMKITRQIATDTKISKVIGLEITFNNMKEVLKNKDIESISILDGIEKYTRNHSFDVFQIIRSECNLLYATISTEDWLKIGIGADKFMKIARIGDRKRINEFTGYSRIIPFEKYNITVLEDQILKFDKLIRDKQQELKDFNSEKKSQKRKVKEEAIPDESIDFVLDILKMPELKYEEPKKTEKTEEENQDEEWLNMIDIEVFNKIFQ